MAITPSQTNIYALTGTIGSGKSTVATQFEQLGAHIIDADILAREVVTPGQDAHQAVREEFGEAYFHEDETLNRKKLGKLVFTDAGKREALEAILHPAIRKAFLHEVEDCLDKGVEEPILYVIPLYYESDEEKRPSVKGVILAYATREDCISRIMKRDSCTEEEAIQKYETQIDMDKKRELADYTIENTTSVEDLRPQVESVYKQLLNS